MNSLKCFAVLLVLAMPSFAESRKRVCSWRWRSAGWQRVCRLLYESQITPYERIGNLFEHAGSTITKKDVSGWFAGRIADSLGPAQIHGAILIGEIVEEVPGGGPGFGKEFKIWQGAARDLPPDWFDKLDEDKVDDIKNARRQTIAGYSKPAFDAVNHEVRFTSYSTKGTYDFIRHTIRKTEDYLVTRLMVYQRGMDNNYQLAFIMYAYYFKNVTPPPEWRRESASSVRGKSLGRVFSLP